jgi:hypothetical protein
MTISFFDPNAVPQPPDKVKIELLEIRPYEDGWRVGVNIHVTPFQQRPSLELNLLKKISETEGKEVAHLSIIETMHHKMEFTMHIRGVDTLEGEYKLKATLFFREAPVEGDETLAPAEIKDTREVLMRI